MKKHSQFLCFIILLTILVVQPPVEILSMGQTGAFTDASSPLDESLPEECETGESETEESETAESETEESETEESVPEESETAESETAESETAESETTESETAESETAESETAESETAESETAESETAESETAESETEESETAESEAPALLSTPTPAAVPDANPLEVIRISTAYSDSLILADCQNAREVLDAKLEKRDYSTAVAILSDNSRVFFPIQYDLDSLDTSQPGFFYLSGTVQVPDDGSVSIDPELSAVFLPVFLYDSETPCELPVISAEPSRGIQIILLQDSSLEDLQYELRYDDEAYLYLEDDIYLAVPLIWDLDSVSLDVPGTYRIYGQCSLPDGILLNEDFSSFPCDVIIQNTQDLSLSPPVFYGTHFITYWAKPTPNAADIRRYYAIGEDGEWEEDTDGSFMRINGSNPQYMYVFYWQDFLFETPYYFQLEHNGKFSNILKVYLTNDQLYYDLIDGDRDGGDRGEQQQPVITPPSEPTLPSEEAPPEETEPTAAQPQQTAPPETEPQSSDDSDSGDSGSYHASGGSSRRDAASDSAEDSRYKAAVADASETTAPENIAMTVPETAATIPQETDTANYTVMSGKRIQKALEINPGRPIIISKHNIRLEIPADSEIFSAMSEQSLFRAELRSLAYNRISVELFIDGLPLSDLPPMTVTMPWQAADKSSALEIKGMDGTMLGNAEYQDSSTIAFPLTKTGAIVIEAPAAAASETIAASVAPVGRQNGVSAVRLLICLCVTGALIFGVCFLHFKKRGRTGK